MPPRTESDEPLDDHHVTLECKPQEDVSRVQSMMDQQLRLKQQYEQLQREMEANKAVVREQRQAIMRGQRQLERQLEMLASPRPTARTPRGGGGRWYCPLLPSCFGLLPFRPPAGSKALGGDQFTGAVPRKASGQGDDARAAHEADVEQSRAQKNESVSAVHDGSQVDKQFSETPLYSDKVQEMARNKPQDLGGDSTQHGDEQHGDERLEELHPSSRNALRLLSWRRNNTLARLHGDSPIYFAAWFAEVATCFAFTAAHIVMLVLWARHDGNQDSYVTTLFVTAIAAATYFAKACHFGDFTINGIVVPLPRYIDWITTTPLMLYELCHIAHASAGTTLMVILCDVMTLACGIIEAMIPWRPHKGIKQIWFFVSCWFFVVMVLTIRFDVAKKAQEQNEVAANLFNQLEVLTVAVWSLYPVIVGIGRANTGLITKPVEDIALCLMDVIAKIGMEGLIVAACYQGCLADSGDH